MNETSVAYTLEALSPILAFWVGWGFMLLGAYVVFPCERADRGLLAFGVGAATFGYIVFVLIRGPDWTPGVLTADVMVPIALVLVSLGGIHMTHLIWQHYDLEPIHSRLLTIFWVWYFRTRNTYRKFRE